MQAQFADYLILKAERFGAMIGSVRGLLRGDTCLVGRLIVYPAAQRQGLGTRLMHNLEVHSLKLRASSFSPGTRARAT